MSVVESEEAKSVKEYCQTYDSSSVTLVDFPSGFNSVIHNVAKTGSSKCEWNCLKILVSAKIIAVAKEYYEQDTSVKTYNGDTLEQNLYRLQTALLSFQGPPFTLQRLCEVIFEPKRFCGKSLNKFLRCMVKMVSVTTVVEAR